MRLIDPIELKRAISVEAMSNNHKTLEQIIDEQPTIEERKTGMWRRAQYGYTCNQCGKTHLLRTAYCPTCGAEMDC